MKKFETLGRSLSKNEQKKIMGGTYPDDGQCGSQCNLTCTVTCNGETVNGNCHTSPHNGKCYCTGVC